MSNYEFKAINLITETFEQRGVSFDVVKHGPIEEVQAGFSVNCGPNVIVRFISRDNDNDVAVRIFGLITGTPEEKRYRVMQACNVVNREIRHVKFYIDGDGDINVEHDFLVHTPDEGVGEMAFEIFIRMMQILDSKYGIFMKALYTNDDFEAQSDDLAAGLMQQLEQLQQLSKMIETRLADDDNDDDDSGLELADALLDDNDDGDVELVGELDGEATV